MVPPQAAAVVAPTKRSAARDMGLPRGAPALLQTPKPSGSAAPQKGHALSALRTWREHEGQG